MRAVFAASLVAQPRAVGAEAVELNEPEAPQRELAVGERRAATDEGWCDGQDQLVQKVGGEQLPRQAPAADEPRPREASLADQPDELADVARETLDRLHSFELFQPLGVGHDPARDSPVRP